MAEELSNQEQDAASSEEYKVSVKPPDYQALTENAKNIVADIKAGMNLPARPTAIDTYSNVAGNPITGSNPGSKKATSGLDYINALHSTVQAKAAESISPFAELRPYTYSGDMDASKFERYYATGDLYNKLGFSPYRDNESLYNNNMTFGDQFTRAAKQWDNLVGVGFMSGLRSWKTMFTDPLAPDIEGARDMERYTSIGSSSAGGLGGFFTNTFLNSAYTVGVGANLLAENLALMGVGTAVKGVTTALRAPAMLEKAMGAFKSADVVADFTKINPMDGVRALGETIPEARSFWNTIGKGAKKVGVGALDIINPLDNTIDALRAKDYATNYAKVAGTFGAFADDMLMMKAAVSEAKLEGGMSKINITKDLIEDYRQRNGRDPEGVDLTNIEKIADEKAHTVAFWNMPAIMTSNKLLYATMLAPLRKVMGKQVAGTVDDYILKDKTYSVLGEDFISRAGAAVKSLGKPNTYGKFGMNYLTANFAEGIQENIQEALSEGASQHALELFRDPIKANYEGYMPYFLKGIKSQFSAQGAETFAGGFLMGAFAQPIMAAPSIGISKIIEAATTDSVRAKELEEERAKHKAETAETLTEFYNNTLNYLAPDLPNAVRTGRLSDDMFSAARVGDKLGTISAQEAIKNHHIITAARTGKLDVMIDRAKDYKNLTKEEAVEAFGKYGVEAQDVDKAMAHIDGIVERAKEIKDDFEDVANRYPNPFNPSNFRIGSPEFIAAAVAKTSWDEAAHNLIFAKATFKSHSKRIADIANTFSKLSSALAKGDVNLLTSMLSSTTMTNEINMLRKEIATLDDSLPEQSKIKKQKLKHLEGIQAFYKAIENYQYAKTDAEKAMVEKRAKDAFAKHLKNIADKNDVPVFDEELDAAFSLIRDHMLLKDQQTGLVKNINVLMTPDSFFQFQKRLYSTYAEGVYNIPDTIGHNLDRHTFTKDLNDIINDIRGLGFNIPQDVIASYSDAYFAGEELLPLVFLLDSNGVKITSGPAFEKANGIWNTFIELTSKKRKTIEAMEYDQDNFLTYPEELKQILTDEYNDLSDEIKAAQNLEDWATGDANIGIRKLFFEGRAAETQGIEERYKSMTIPELTTALEELAEQAKTDPKLDAKVTVLQDYIAYRAVEAVDMPEKQKQALRNMKAQAANTQNRDKDNEKYILNGKKLDTRVTTVVQEILAKKYGLSPFNFPNTGYGKEILKDQKDMLEQLIEEKQDKNIIVNIWADTVSNTRAYKDRWDDSKTALLKETLKEKFTYEDFEKAVSSLAYQESKTGGNTVDEIARNFLTGTPISKPGNMTQEAFNKLRGILKDLMNTIRERGEIILAKDLFLKGEVIIDGVKQTIGGEMDMLVIDKDGNLKIYDFKTGRNYKWEMYGTEADEKGTDTKDPTLYKKGYGLQLSLYKRLIEEQTGLTVDSNKLTIVPFIINVSNNGMINDIELSNEDKNIIHEYNPVVEEYIPVTKTAAYSPQPFVQAIEVLSDKSKTDPEFETIGKYSISKPSIDKDGKEIVTVESTTRPGKGMTYIVNTDENGSVISLTPKNNPKQHIVNEKLLVAVEIKRNKYEYNSPTINNIAKDEEKYNKVKELLPAVTVLENTLNLGLDNSITSALNNLYANKPLDRASLIAIQLWANGAAKRLDNFLQNEYKDNAEFTKAWENMYLINELVEERLNTLAEEEVEEKPVIEEPAVKRQPGKSVDQLLRERDKELKFIQEKRKELGIEFDPLDDVPMSVVITMDRFDNNLPIDPVALSETSDWLYNKYKEIDDMLLDPKRMLTQAQIKQYKKALEKDITALENYKQEQYGEKIIQNETARSTSTTTGETRGTVSRDKTVVEKTSFDEPIKGKTKKHREAKVKKAVEKAAKENAVVTTETEEELFPKVYTVETINAELNLQSLQEAKAQKLEVEYKGNRYKIKRVGKKSVTLYAPNRDDVNIKEEDLAKELTVVEPGVKKATVEETEQVVKNEELVNTTERVFEEIPTDKTAMDKAVNKRKDDFLNNLCI
jgi:hypothetical protein